MLTQRERPESSVIAVQDVDPGTRHLVRLRVTRDLDGGDVAVWVHVIRGARPGPTLGLFGVQHGDEWVTVDYMRQLVAQLDETQMTGTVLVVPVCNPMGLAAGQRITQPESDGPDLNRVWPGAHTWISDSIAKVIDHEVLKHCDALLDYHPGTWGVAAGQVMYGTDYPDQDVVRQCRELGIAFGYPSLRKGKVVGVFPGPCSLTSYAGTKLGIPNLTVEIGGIGYGIEQERCWATENIRGVKNVMRYLGMLDEPLEKPERILTYDRCVRVNPTTGGLLLPERERDTVLREVREGALLGRVISPHTFEELERLEAPCEGWLIWVARSRLIRPGSWAFGVADASGAEWITP